ncbi:MAG TPA: ABC transporter permease [candidate division Zixibacteria bacterium]|nr:ABC transporter permease [candidate division Zixibacteria bacterium]
MVGYIVRRVLWIIPVLLVVSIITFSLMKATPGGPWDREKELSPRQIALLNSKFGLDDPLPVQYIRWLVGWPTDDGGFQRGLLLGDLGPSYRYPDRSVNEIVADGIWTTVQLGVMAFLLAVIVGIPLGVIAALRQNALPDYIATFISVLGITTPSFVIATLLMVVFSVTLGWFPTSGWRGPEYWVLPTVALALAPIASIARYTRASMLEVTRKDYVRTAHSKGLKERTVVLIHMIRNALIPVVTILGPILAFLVTGSFIIELLFSVPGIGRFYVNAIGTRDYGLIMAMTMLYAGAVAFMNMVVDILYAYIDPRIRYS